MSCYLCHSNRHTEFIKNGDWTVLKCADCGHGLTHPFPKPEVLHEMYDRRYFDSHYAHPEPGSRHFKKHVTDNFHRVRKARRYQRDGNLLDVGCGNGLFLYAADKYYNGIGFDVSNGNKAYLDKIKIHVIVSDWNAIEFKPDFFDVITFWHSIEHFDDPIRYVKRATGWLKKEGVAIIEVPNHACIDAHVSGHNWENWDLPFHLHHFTENSLELFCSKVGLGIVDRYTYHSEFIKNKLRETILFRMFARQISKMFHGNGIAVVCRKI
ncbi:MAG: class I SAM-dependent methyltransferase [Deltaproteobacteria bacterium]|nr:class I SAM-dependent methyltransferase [Deltaproteobacteria bacterium]